jgi:hypothetical protein
MQINVATFASLRGDRKDTHDYSRARRCARANLEVGMCA